MRKILISLAEGMISIAALPILMAIALASRLQPQAQKPRLVFGSTPIISYSTWAKAMRGAGFEAETFVDSFYSAINKRSDWNRVLGDEFRLVPRQLRPYLAFGLALRRYDIFVTSCDGFFLGSSFIWRAQSPLLRLARKKVVVLPYGSDAYVYKRVRSSWLTHGLMVSYPEHARRQDLVARRVDYWVKSADVFIPGFMGFDGMGRWDILVPNAFCVDLNRRPQTKAHSLNDGTNGSVTVAHSYNHAGFKGTQFIEAAVTALNAEGLDVRLELYSGIQNDQLQEKLLGSADIVFEQCLAVGYAFSAIEGMSLGLPTMANLDDGIYTEALRTHSFLDECPVVSATPITLLSQLRRLVTNPTLRAELGARGRSYVEAHHSEDAAREIFAKAIGQIW